MNKYGRIPSIPLEASKKEKAIKGEILVNWDGQYLMGKNPITGEIVRLGDADSLLGIVNYIANTNFDIIPPNFKEIEGINELNISKETGWYKSNELYLSCLSNAKIFVESEYNIYKNKNYTLTFYARCNKNTTMHISFDDCEFDIAINKSPMSKYKLVINTNNFKRNSYDGFYISFDNENFDIYISQFMFEYGATANAWTDRTEITSVKVGDMNVNGILSVNGIDIMSLITGEGTKGTTATANDIVTNKEFLIPKTNDSNYDLISFTGKDNEDTVIAYKGFNDLLYGTYSIMIRMKCSNTTGINRVAVVNIYEYSSYGTVLLSSSDIYPYHFNNEDEFEELGIISKYKGNNSDDDDRMIIVEIVACGDGNTNLKVDYIYMQLSYASLLPINTRYN